MGEWWHKKNSLVDRFVDDMPGRAARPVSVRDDVTLREDCTAERHGDRGRRARTWSAILNEFLNWYNNYRHAHLLFRSPEGDRVRAPMPNSHQPEYGNKYYARLKALERQMVARYDDLHVAMLTLTGSTKNGNGGWRCPADHLRDVVSSWRPDRGRGVYHTLRDALDGHRWEYALVVEKHQSGYGHVHVAVFVDGAVDEADFRPVIDAHLRECEIAHRRAHDYFHPDDEKRPISIRGVDTDLDLDDLDTNREDVEEVTNIGSYIGEYIGALGDPLFERGIDELAFRAAAWATGTQLVRFSNGANEMIRDDRGDDVVGPEPGEPRVVPNEAFDFDAEGVEKRDEMRKRDPFLVYDEGWTIEGIARIDEDGEDVFDLGDSGVQYATIEAAPAADPPNPQPPDRPQRRTSQVPLGD